MLRLDLVAFGSLLRLDRVAFGSVLRLDRDWHPGSMALRKPCSVRKKNTHAVRMSHLLHVLPFVCVIIMVTLMDLTRGSSGSNIPGPWISAMDLTSGSFYRPLRCRRAVWLPPSHAELDILWEVSSLDDTRASLLPIDAVSPRPCMWIS